MLHQRSVIPVGFIMCREVLISPDHSTKHAGDNFCRTAMHELCEVHPFQTVGSVTEARLDKPRTVMGLLFNFLRRADNVGF
ncbi:MAG TPA: hypothetical protein VGL82_21965 [Bryobacteraceae bacterium]